MEKAKFIILGAGAWGTAMAIHLSKMHLKTVLSPRSREKADRMNEIRENCFYLPGITFPKNLIIDTNFERYIDDDSVVFLACPTKGLVDICERLKSFELPLSCIISLVKGLDKTSLRTPSEVISSILTKVERVICLSGPTYAYEFALG